MKTKLTLISKNIKVEKICLTNTEINNFYRDMPSKYGLLFTKIPYAINEKQIN